MTEKKQTPDLASVAGEMTPQKIAGLAAAFAIVMFAVIAIPATRNQSNTNVEISASQANMAPATDTLDPLTQLRGGRAIDAAGSLIFDQNDPTDFVVMPAGARYIFGHGQSRATLEAAPFRAAEGYFALCLPDSDGSWVTRAVFLKSFAEGVRGRVVWSEYEPRVKAYISQDVCGQLLDETGEMAAPSIASSNPLE